ncbi:MAG: hypothetical protein KGI00_01520 [Candidatus Micrarchaeota archaeon]|nr:hypothetical protein [Candidatus Micrarchaeota archaeon]MDE1849388.1 hypothetical protein [Candidatus Micrarchaeota archaeon]
MPSKKTLKLEKDHDEASKRRVSLFFSIFLFVTLVLTMGRDLGNNVLLAGEVAVLFTAIFSIAAIAVYRYNLDNISMRTLNSVIAVLVFFSLVAVVYGALAEVGAGNAGIQMALMLMVALIMLLINRFVH